MSTKDLNTTRAAFMRKASAPDINSLALKLAYLIAFKYMDGETGTTFVAQETLARDLNVTSRTVRTLLDILQPFGLTIVPGHGPNRASTYWIDPGRATPGSPIKTEKRKPASGYKRKPASGSQPNTGNLTHDNRKLDDTNTGSQLPPYLSKDSKKTPRREESDSAPLFAALDSEEGSPANPGSKTEPKSQPRPKPKKADLDSAFAEFWAAYPRRAAKLAAEKAFAAAVKRGHDPATLIAGAKRYAAERTGQDPKFTKHPSTWLNGGCWLDESSPANGPPVIDQDGNIVAVPEPPARRSRPQSFEEAAEELLREAEENGTGW